MKKLIERSYKAIKARGLIKEDTTCEDFYNKMCEELREAQLTQMDGFGQDSESHYIEECIDLATVCFMQVLHLGYNPIKEFEKVVIKNEERARKCILENQSKHIKEG